MKKPCQTLTKMMRPLHQRCFNSIQLSGHARHVMLIHSHSGTQGQRGEN